MAKCKNPVVLIVADGWGIAPPGPGNYISLAKTPNFNSYLSKYPHTENEASGRAVGLPAGVQGNSEVGHLHLGAGRIVWQMYERINNAIEDKSFFSNDALLSAVRHAKTNGTKLHIMGLCSDEGVHAHVRHLFALLEMAKNEGVSDVFIHFFADGRDVPEKSALTYVRMIEDECARTGVGRIASVIGRYYSLDRDTSWEDRTKKAYDMLVLGTGFRANTAVEAVEMAYSRGDKTDYYIQPTVIVGPEDEPVALVEDNDSVIFFNFRTDRPKQLTHAFLDENFTHFRRDVWPKVYYTSMTRYDNAFNCPVAFNEEKVKNNIGHVISDRGLLQLRMAETEKYAHVTYFFNSQEEGVYPGEERAVIPSSKVPSYDLKPEMSAYEITDECVKRIAQKKYDFILVNFANCDLVGHSGVKDAIIKCVEVVDGCVEKVVSACLANGYVCILTADHGSAEDKLYPDGLAKPAHSSNPVNFFVISDKKELLDIKLRKGGQKDVAPTILDIMGIAKPKEMTGGSLIKK